MSLFRHDDPIILADLELMGFEMPFPTDTSKKAFVDIFDSDKLGRDVWLYAIAAGISDINDLKVWLSVNRLRWRRIWVGEGDAADRRYERNCVKRYWGMLTLQRYANEMQGTPLPDGVKSWNLTSVLRDQDTATQADNGTETHPDNGNEIQADNETETLDDFTGLDEIETFDELLGQDEFDESGQDIFLGQDDDDPETLENSTGQDHDSSMMDAANFAASVDDQPSISSLMDLMGGSRSKQL